MKKVREQKIRSVDQYLTLLKAAGRSDITIRNYRQVLKQYAAFLNVPLDKLHEHLDPDDLVRYATAISSKRDAGRKSTMITIHRFMAVNGVQFDELEDNVTKVRVTQERDDKPLTTEILQKMMDQATPHGKALLTFLVSTGCRAGETSEILLSDVGRIENDTFVPDITGSVVRIRPEIAKRRHGGLVFLTSEAREYLTVWLKDRDRFIRDADKRTAQLYTASTRHERVPRKGIGQQISRPANDKRLFACSYGTIDKTFNRLYRAVDGERGLTGNKITAHGCRAYFRTHAPKGGMSIDLTEGILRHTGYLNAAYVRMTKADIEREFHTGEAALYITRADHRIQTGKISQIEQENAALRRELENMKATQATTAKLDAAASEEIIAEVMRRLRKNK